MPPRQQPTLSASFAIYYFAACEYHVYPCSILMWLPVWLSDHSVVYTAIAARPEGVNSVWWCCALGAKRLELTLELIVRALRKPM
jgi:hypothetical protein